MDAGIPISASISQSNPAATGALQTGGFFQTGVVGGSVGFSLQSILIVAAVIATVAAAVWFLFFRKRKGGN